MIGLQLADCRADESNFTREFASTNSNVHISSEKYMRWFEEQMKQKVVQWDDDESCSRMQRSRRFD